MSWTLQPSLALRAKGDGSAKPYRDNSLFRAEAFAVVFLPRHLEPLRVGEVPFDGVLEARREVVLGLPAELRLRLAGVDRVAAVVAGAVLDELDQLLARADRQR